MGNTPIVTENRQKLGKRSRMLTYLHVKNLALIDEAEVEFGPGLNILTGETGAGKSFEVIAHNYSPTNKYIQSAKLNGKDWNQSWFEHKELMNGGKLEFTMGNTPNKNWAADSVPPSFEMNK